MFDGIKWSTAVREEADIELTVPEWRECYAMERDMTRFT